MHIVPLITVMMVTFTISTSARADAFDDCTQGRNMNLSISGCTAVIGSGHWQGKSLAWAYNNRGVAYSGLGKYHRAIEDYDQALRLDPDDANAYINRGNAYGKIGEYDKAIGDWDKLNEIDGATLVRIWQKLLKAKGKYTGPVDGVYGPATRRALQACAADPNC